MYSLFYFLLLQVEEYIYIYMDFTAAAYANPTHQEQTKQPQQHHNQPISSFRKTAQLHRAARSNYHVPSMPTEQQMYTSDPARRESIAVERLEGGLKVNVRGLRCFLVGGVD
jgi:hypothetical protein